MTAGSEKLLAGFQQRTAQPAANPLRPKSYGAGMAESFLASFPELVGIEPDLDVQRWRVENPAGGITSQLLGLWGSVPGMVEGSRQDTQDEADAG